MIDFSVSDTNGELVNVAVPKQYLGDVYQLLGVLVAKDSGNNGPKVPWPTDGEEATKNEIDWTDVSNCRKLRKHLKNQAALAMLNLAAEKADQEEPKVYLTAVMESANCTHGEAS